ncbi:MAG: caspase family protein [Thioploca sp.]|nr:caspase family protein [Thioploca sp.]
MPTITYRYFRYWWLSSLLWLLMLSNAIANYALLVGVSHYDNLKPEQQLIGPVNDVHLMRQVLLAKGFADARIQVLTNTNEARLPADLSNALSPTRNNIFKALDELIKKVTPPDFVYLHFSGHGSQQPSHNKSITEPDGLDEIFLPSDVGRWEDSIGQVRNAIVDDEIQDKLTALRNRAKFVWIVFDSCHSGTMTRAITVTGVQTRRVEMDDLGIPKTKQLVRSNPSLIRGVSRRQESLLDESAAKLEKGHWVAFYAAQTTETTPEMLLPVNYAQQRHYGLFTYTLAEVLSRYDNATYREAAQWILNRYKAQELDKPTPLFEGHLDTVIFDSTTAKISSKWPLIASPNGDKFKIKAGQLYQLYEGSRFAVYPNLMSTRILGYLEITQAKPFESILQSIPYAGKARLTQVPSAAFAELIAPRFNFTLQVALPPDRGSFADKLTPILTTLSADIPQIKWVKTDSAIADVRLAIQNNKLWLLPPNGELIITGSGRTPAIRLDKTDRQLREVLSDSFKRIAHAHNLLRLAIGMTRLGQQSPIQISLQITQAGKSYPFPRERIPILQTDDEVKVKLENVSNQAVDLTLLDIDSQYRIEPIFPTLEETSNRIEAKKLIELPLSICVGDVHKDEFENRLICLPDPEKTGLSHLVFIAVQAQPNTMNANFTFLAQQALPPERDVSQLTADQKALDALFVDAVFTGEQRAVIRRQQLQQADMQVFSWEMN